MLTRIMSKLELDDVTLDASGLCVKVVDTTVGPASEDISTSLLGNDAMQLH